MKNVKFNRYFTVGNTTYGHGNIAEFPDDVADKIVAEKAGTVTTAKVTWPVATTAATPPVVEEQPKAVVKEATAATLPHA